MSKLGWHLCMSVGCHHWEQEGEVAMATECLHVYGGVLLLRVVNLLGDYNVSRHYSLF